MCACVCVCVSVCECICVLFSFHLYPMMMKILELFFLNVISFLFFCHKNDNCLIVRRLKEIIFHLWVGKEEEVFVGLEMKIKE